MTGRITPFRPLAWVWHADTIRKHVANLCLACHRSDCFVCAQAKLLGLLPEAAAS